ncbi:MAG TPA: diguanylate cyclase [Polyangiaceae bacterium]|nr:diguanylate cyclase [Polyangiaceae bacterium]
MGARILLVDDSPAIRKQIRMALEGGMVLDQLFEAEDGIQGFKMLVEHRPDVVVCDLVMPAADGLKFLALRASKPELADIPVLMLTAEAELSRKVEVFERGAADYVTKPFNDRELLARVRVHYRVKALQDELKEANARLEALATTDALTGLYNRRYLDTVLFSELKRTLRYKAPLSIILVDIDRFKLVNDTYGHAVGDAVLRNVAGLITRQARTTDVTARYGGEEIVLVLPHTDARGAGELAERLRQLIGEATHLHGEASVKTTASFGIATYMASAQALNPEELLRQADEALYEAKRSGRNRVAVWRAPADR